MLTPSSSALTDGPTDNLPPVAADPDQLPAAEQEANAPADSFQALVPYLQASPFQRAQGLRSARVILDAAYLFLEPAQWQQALDYLQLPLHVRGGQATFLPDGLGALVHYLEAQYRSQSTSGLPAFTAPGRPDAALRLLAEEPTTKQTHAIRNSLIEKLVRVCHWRRQSRTWFVNAALAQLLSQYPEALIPVPEDNEE